MTVPCFAVLLRELSDFDGEWHGARSEDVDHAVVCEPSLEAQFLQEPRVLPGGCFGLVFAVGTRARDLARRPHRRCRVRVPELHRNHLEKKTNHVDATGE